MKDTLKRLFGTTQTAEAVTEKEDEHMSADASQETVVQLTTALEAVTSELAQANTKIAELTALVDAATEFKAAAEKRAAELKAKVRKEKLEATVGTDKADAMLTATASLSDDAFDSIVAAMATNLTAEAKTEPFKEAGVAGEASKAALDALTQSSQNVMNYLQAEKA